MNFYNENDPKAAVWLRELIKSNEIPEGKVDERSITEIEPDELDGFAQCHFFAGIGGWSLAFKLAGWPDSRPVWSASLPCQPFSTAGQSRGTQDERHLWPVFFDLVKVCRPDIIFGEQVARAIGFNWLDGISADLETAHYSVGQAVLGAHSVGSPHKRQRLYWLGVSDGAGRESGRIASETAGHRSSAESASCLGVTLGDAKREGLQGLARNGYGGDETGWIGENTFGSTSEAGAVGELADLQGSRREDHLESRQKEMFSGTDSNGITGSMEHLQEQRRGEVSTNGSGERCAQQRNELRERDSGARKSSAWSDYDLIYCRDDKFRRVEAGTFPLANGIQGRVGLLRGYGNAIVPPLAAQFIQAGVEAINEVESQPLSPKREVAQGCFPYQE